MFGGFQCDVFQQNAFQNVCGQQVAETFSGGWPIPRARKRRLRDRDAEVRAQRIALGILPPDEEERVEDVLDLGAKAIQERSRATPETQAATDAFLDQQRAELLFMQIYLAIYPALERERLAEVFRLESERLSLEMEEEGFAMLLLTL